MTHSYSFYRGQKRSRQSRVHYRQLLQGRSLAVMVPLLVCLLFSGLYGMQHASSVAEEHAASTSTSAIRTSSATNVGYTSNLPTSSSSGSSSGSTASNPSPTKTTPSAQTKANTPANSLPSLTKAPADVCDSAAKALATSTEQAARNFEDARHTARLLLLTTDSLTNALLNQNTPAVNDEYTLHAVNIQKIETAFQAGLAASHC